MSKKVVIRIIAALGIIIFLGSLLPLIYTLFLVSLGIIGILITGLIGIGIVWSYPLLAQKFENWLLKERVKEASENPIETRRNISLRQRKEIEEAQKTEADTEAVIKNVERSLISFKSKYPNQDVSEYSNALIEARQLHAAMGENIKHSSIALREYEDQTEMLEDRLKMALGFQNLAKAMNSQSVQKAYDKLFTETATKAVDEKFDSSMASLRQVMKQVEINKLLENNSATAMQLKIPATVSSSI